MVKSIKRRNDQLWITMMLVLFLLLLTSFTGKSLAEGSTRTLKLGERCTQSSECKSQMCCEQLFGSPGYCSACCEDSDCATGDVCAIRMDVYPILKMRACYRKYSLPYGNICSKNSTCSSRFCSRGDEYNWNAINGECAYVTNPAQRKTFLENYDYGYGYDLNDIRSYAGTTPRECQLKCQQEPNCHFFSLHQPLCWLKTKAETRLLILNCVSGPKFALGDCTTPSYTKSDGKKYCAFYLYVMYTFNEAQKVCEDLTSRMLEIRTQNDYNALSVLKPTLVNRASFYWLNAKASHGTGSYVWISNNSPVKYINWAPGYPKSSVGERCLILDSRDGTFQDADCGSKFVSLWEKETI